MKSVGRPNKEKSRLRNHRITVRLNDGELIDLFEKSRRLMVSPSSFLRMAGLSQRLPIPLPEVNILTFQELGRIGNNLNQLLKRLYEDRTATVPLELFQELTALLHQIRTEIRGNHDRQADERERVPRRSQLRIGPP
ncbi:plasmid mobilization protein [Geobacter anodireducens]